MDNLLSSVLQAAYQNLSSLSDTPQLDAQVLIAHILEKPRAWVLSHAEAKLATQEVTRINEAIERLVEGEPLPYVLGSREFYALDFKIDNSVLIPRPETELIVEESLAWIDSQEKNIKGVDIGTGSGCIAISIAVNSDNGTFDAYDINTMALEIAQYNAKKHDVNERITFQMHDISSGFLHTSYDLIVTNPPYIPTDTLHTLEVFGREPTNALDGGMDGLEHIRRILHLSAPVLNPGGLLLCEIESSQGEIVFRMARTLFPGAEISILKDLASHDRVLKIINKKHETQ